MSLIQKIFHNEVPAADSHALSAILRLLFRDEIVKSKAITDIETMLTANNGGVAYTLTAGESNQVDEFEAHYDGQPNANSKQDYLAILEATFVLAEHGVGTYLAIPKFKSINGLVTE